jgi:uncharacterized heparinase superfamily protein
MSSQEILWRLQVGARGLLDRPLHGWRKRPLKADILGHFETDALPAKAKSFPAHIAKSAAPLDTSTLESSHIESLIHQAEAAKANQFSFFDLQNSEFGDPIDWNREYKAQKQCPTVRSGCIDYRDYRSVGDCKFVWEPSRHHQLVVLGRAYRATSDETYAYAVLRHLESWMNQCPFGTGMNWRSPLELGIRLINWVWALELIKPSGLVTGDFARRLLGFVYRHLWEIDRNYSRFSSANNHLIGEAAGVFVGSSYFTQFHDAQRWQARSRDILCEEIHHQTYADGGSREQAMGYQLFVMEFFTVAATMAEWQGTPFPPRYRQQLERMFDFVSGFAEAGGRLPLFGDCDDGYVLDLGDRDNRVAGLMGLGAALFDRTDWAALAGDCVEPVYWLFGPEQVARVRSLQHAHHRNKLTSRAFNESGYYLLQYGSADRAESISVSMDCGELGYGAIAAHGHADALSLTLRVNGQDILVDPGTYDYFTYPEWRSYFRSTRAHNTITVDGADQSEMQGPFLWGQRANAELLAWQPDAEGGHVSGRHDGYRRLPGAVGHERSVHLRGNDGSLQIQDILTGSGEHHAEICFQFGPECLVEVEDDNRLRVTCKDVECVFFLDSQLRISTYDGSETNGYGWFSDGYHRRCQTTSIVGECQWNDRMTLQTEIVVKNRFAAGEHDNEQSPRFTERRSSVALEK